MQTPSTPLNIDADLEHRINRLAEARHQSTNAILREAIQQYLEREEKPQASEAGPHPSGKPWPRRTPVGGIITPV